MCIKVLYAAFCKRRTTVLEERFNVRAGGSAVTTLYISELVSTVSVEVLACGCRLGRGHENNLKL